MEDKKEKQKRHEIKFLINSKEQKNFIIKNNLTKIFPDRIIESIYYDTKNFQFFNLSEEGVTPRFKVRLRGYNEKDLNNLEIKTTNNYYREKVIFKNFTYDNFELHNNLKKIGINNIVEEKIRIKYLRSYYEYKNLGRITIDKNIEFFSPSKEFHISKKINQIILEVKIQSEEIDKNTIEKIINFKETRFSKYCIGINCIRETK